MDGSYRIMDKVVGPFRRSRSWGLRKGGTDEAYYSMGHTVGEKHPDAVLIKLGLAPPSKGFHEVASP